MNTCFPCVLRVSAPAEKYAMLFVSADFISVTRHCRSCCLLFLLLLLLPPTHAHTHTRALLVVRVFPFAGHLLSLFAFALRRIASFCLRDNKHHKSFFLPNGTPRPAPLPLPLYHYWLPFPLCLFVSVSVSSFRAAPLEPFRRRRQLAASVSPLFVFVFRLGHRLLLFAVCWPLCRTALCRTGQRHISTHTLCLPLAAPPWGHQRRQRQAVLVFSGLRGSLRCLQRLQIVFGSV